MDRQRSAGLVEHHHLVRAPGPCGGADGADEHAEQPGPPLLGTEGQPPDGRVQAIGAEDQVETLRRTCLELDINTIRVLVQRSNGVIEDDACLLTSGFEQHPREVDAGNLHLVFAAGALAAVNGGQPATTTVDEDQPSHTRCSLLKLRPDTHRVRNGRRLAADINRIPAGPSTGRLLDYGHVPASASEPIGQRQPGYTGTGNQRCSVSHIRILPDAIPHGDEPQSCRA